MTTKDMDLDCYGINLETADNEAFKRMIIDELKNKIDSLQRYTNTTDDGMEVSPNGYWVSFKDVYDLLNLLKND